MNMRLIMQGMMLCISVQLRGMLFQKYEKPNALNFKNLSQALETTELGCKLSKKALSSLLKRKLEDFDVGVGDSLCEIRADFVVKQLEKLDEQQLETLKNDYRGFYENIKNITFNPNDHKAAAVMSQEVRGKTISEFFNKRNVEVPDVSDDLRMLMLNHAIKQCYNEVGSEIRVDLIQRYGLSLTTNFFKDLVVGMRKELNTRTVSYLISLGDELLNNAANFLIDDSRLRRLKLLVDGLSQYAGDKLFSSPPKYFGVALLVEDLRLNRIPIMLRTNVLCDKGVHQHAVVLKAGNDGEFVVHNDAENLKETAIFVVDGITDLMGTYNNMHTEKVMNDLDHLEVHDEDCEKLLEFSQEFGQEMLQDILLANAAMHSQFVKKGVEIDFTPIKDIEQEFDEHKKLALDKGFCMENMRLFRITHIYAAVGKQLFEGNN